MFHEFETDVGHVPTADPLALITAGGFDGDKGRFGMTVGLIPFRFGRKARLAPIAVSK